MPSPGWRLALAIGMHTLGVVLMMAADAQKYFTLKVRRGLIEDGLFARIRHPNYLGEMMLYAAYAVVVDHWIPWVVLAWVWGAVFLPNMLLKEASMSRYPGWSAYKARTGMLWPWFTPQTSSLPANAAHAVTKPTLDAPAQALPVERAR